MEESIESGAPGGKSSLNAKSSGGVERGGVVCWSCPNKVAQTWPKQQSVVSHGSGAWKSVVTASGGLLPCEATSDSLFQAFLLASDGLRTIFGIPWLMEASPQSLSSSSHGFLPECVRLSPNCPF